MIIKALIFILGLLFGAFATSAGLIIFDKPMASAVVERVDVTPSTWSLNNKDECSLDSTAIMGDCLDSVLKRKESAVQDLETKLINSIEIKMEKIKTENLSDEISGYDSLLQNLMNHQKVWKNEREEKCSLKLSLETGTAIVEESRKCSIVETDEYIKILKELTLSL